MTPERTISSSTAAVADYATRLERENLRLCECIRALELKVQTDAQRIAWERGSKLASERFVRRMAWLMLALTVTAIWGWIR